MARLPKYAGLCVQHRKVVGSDDYAAVWQWAIFHAKAWRCPPPEVDATKKIRQLIIEQGLVDVVRKKL
jgi:hypothetical protein